MNEKQIAKEAFAEAEKEQREKKIQEVKLIVQKTLEKIAKAKEIREKADEEIKYLKMDLDDLKNGRLDVIEERQKKDDKARNYSVVVFSKLSNTALDYSVYKIPYNVKWIDTTYNNGNYVYTTTCNCSDLNGSLFKTYSTGTYVVSSKAINFR